MGLSVKKRKTDITIIIALLTFSLFLHRGYFYPGIMTKGDWGFNFKEQMEPYFSLPYAWWSEISISTMKTPMFAWYPLIITYGVLAKFFSFDFSILERVLFFFPVTFLPALSMYYLTHSLFKNRVVCLFSAILYSSNTLILLWSITWLTLSMTYSLTPLILALFIQSLQEKSSKKVVLTSIILAISFAYEARITYMTLWILVLYFLYINLIERSLPRLISSLKMLAYFGITLFMLVAYWVLPFFLGGGREASASRLSLKPWTSFNQLIHAITLKNSDYAIIGEMRSFVVQPVNPIFFIILIIAFSAILLRKKEKNVIFFSLLALIGIFLVKGENPPFGFIYTWLFENFPGFNLFRDASKLFPLIALSYSVLFGVAISDLGKIIGRKIKRQSKSKMAVICFFTLVFSSQVIMAWPALAYQMKTYTGRDYYPSLPAPPEEYLKIKTFITEQPSGFRTLWLPEISRFSFYSREYPTIPTERFSQTDITAISNLATPAGNSDYFSRLLAAWNIKYVILSPENELDPMYERFPQENYVEFLNKQEGLRRVHIGEGIYVYENTLYSRSRFFILKAEEKYFPSEDTIEEFDFENGLNEWSINFANKQKMFLSNVSYSGEHSLGIELNTSDLDWKVVSSPLIPAECGSQYRWQLYVKGENAHQVHVKIDEYNSSRNRIKTHYIGFTNDGTFDWKKITFDFFPVSPNASYMQLQVWHGHETNKSLPNKVWLDDIAVSLIYSINEADNTLKDMLSPKKSPAEIVEYKGANPTKYTVEVNATEPFILVFAEAYDPLWAAYVNGERIESIPLYSVTNGFWINKTGQLQITIEYEPQKWFYYGLITSATTFLACLTYLTYNSTKNKKIWKRIKSTPTQIKEFIQKSESKHA